MYNPFLEAPKYAPDAIPTVRGWVSAKTGELLHAIKLDMNNFVGYVKEEVQVVETKVEETVEQVEEKVSKSKKSKSKVEETADAPVEQPTKTEAQVESTEVVADAANAG